MAEPLTAGAGVVLSGAKAGLFTAMVAMIATDQDMAMVITVGIIGGIAYIIKKSTIEAFKKDLLGSILNIPFSILMAVSLTGIIFYGGKDGFNEHIEDMGIYFWIFLAFMASMNYDKVIRTSVSIGVAISNKAIEKWHKL